ncbi:MAG TPA: DUF3631 domain-containing protein [Candidatus Angelobacter sp.]|nr:DUF3631 domain-containing protein [Candidatus Angelobacter sp.]
MQPSNSTWTWTLIQTIDPGQLHYLFRSPEGRLIFPHWLVGKPFSIKAHDVDRGQPAVPHADDLRGSRDFFQVELGPDLFMATCLRPDGTPELPPYPYNKVWRAEKQPDGSWRFLSESEFVVMRDDIVMCWTKDSIPTSGPKPSVKTGGPMDSVPSSGPKDSKLPNYQVTQLPNSSSPNSSSPNYQLTQLPNASSPDPIQTMDDLTNLIRQHLVCTDHQSTVLALWILHTYTYKAAHLTPYLNISSRVEESGKSTCMTILRSLCAQPWWAAGVSRSAFTRKINADHPTVLLDNWQTVFSGSDKTQMTGFLLNGCDHPNYGNSGDEACTEASRSGDPNYPITNLPNYPIPSPNYPISFCPKAFAGPDPLPPSLARRSIPIVLERRKPSEVVKRAMNLLAPGAAAKLTSWMQQWARAHTKQIETTFENSGGQGRLLPSLTPHQRSSAQVLIVLADAIGGDWSQKARAALPEVFKDAQQTEISLLSDIRDAFAHHGNPERIFSSELLDYLYGLDQRLWHEWGKKGEPMTPHALSVILRKSFKIYSRSQRRGEDKRRGYQLSDFIEAWERYLPTQTPQNTSDQNATKEGHETSVAATIEPVSLEKKPNSESPDNKHRIRRAEVARTEVSQRRAEVACTEVSQRRAEVRQRAKTAVHPEKSRFISISRLTDGYQRIVNRVRVNWFQIRN